MHNETVSGWISRHILMLLFILASNKQIILHHNFFVYLSRNTNTVFNLISGLSAYVILGPKFRPFLSFFFFFFFFF